MHTNYMKKQILVKKNQNCFFFLSLVLEHTKKPVDNGSNFSGMINRLSEFWIKSDLAKGSSTTALSKPYFLAIDGSLEV